MSRLGSVPTAEQSLHHADAKWRRRSLASTLLLLTIAIWTATRPLTPFMFAIAVVVLILALYGNSVAWRKFSEREKAKTAAFHGWGPEQLGAVLDDVERLLDGHSR